jgi:Holliday junction resolvase RusA-like endonuclease
LAWPDPLVDAQEEEAVIYQFEIPGKPRAKQSARAVRTANGVRFFQPGDITNYHGRVSALARQVIPAPLEGPIYLRLSIVLRTPTSWSKKRKATLNHAITRPDVDNATKALMDGLNEVAWADDRQVVDLHVEKHYGNRDAVIVTITTAA